MEWSRAKLTLFAGGGLLHFADVNAGTLLEDRAILLLANNLMSNLLKSETCDGAYQCSLSVTLFRFRELWTTLF